MISIHTPLAGSDGHTDNRQSWTGPISIHTPLAGSDRARSPTPRSRRNFNPHSPCGERPPAMDAGQLVDVFQSTLPLRGATRSAKIRLPSADISIHTPLAGSDFFFPVVVVLRGISIHTPLAGSDSICRPGECRPCNFNPHSPCGERLICSLSRSMTVLFQSTLPLRGATSSGTHGEPE